MVWAHLYASDGTLLLVCPAQDAGLWSLLDGAYWFRYELVEESP
jgi:hypothetical protein